MRRRALAVLLIGTAARAWAADAFISNMRKADSRAEADEKIEYYTRAIDAWAPTHGNELLAYCRFRRGEAHYYQNELDRAEPDLSKAIELDPGNNRAYYYRGQLYLRQRRFDKAVRDLQEYSLAVKQAEGYWRLAEAYERAGNFLPAAKQYRQAQAADAEDYRPILGLARLAAGQRKDSAALEFFQQAEALAGGHSAEVFADKALFESRAARHEDAIDDFGRAAAIFEERLSSLERSADGRPLEVFDQKSGLARTYFGRAQSYEARGQPGPAQTDYQAACKLGLSAACAKATSPRHQAVEVKQAPQKRYPKANSDPGNRIYAN